MLDTQIFEDGTRGSDSRWDCLDISQGMRRKIKEKERKMAESRKRDKKKERDRENWR